ncbi:Gamma-glutamyl-gamma-aminobutyrate hydrolase PuuD [compost metagenome]
MQFTAGSWLQFWLGRDSARVNSIHQQGIKRLADGLIAEAVAEDGLIEAYRVGSASNFAYAVQWHPEWKYWDNDVSQAIFEAFGAACRERRMRRNQ